MTIKVLYQRIINWNLKNCWLTTAIIQQIMHKSWNMNQDDELEQCILGKNDKIE